MKTKHIKIAQVIIAALFVFAVLYFVLGITMDRKDGPQKAQMRFNTFMVEASTIAAKYEPNSPAFNGEFTQLVIKYQKDLASLRLDVNSKRIYEYPTESHTSDVVTHSFSRSTPTVLGNTLTVNATMYAVNQIELYSYARISFILILVGTVAAVILLLIIQFTAVPHYRRLKQDDDDIVFTDESDVPEVARNEEEENEDLADDDFDPISAMEKENRESSEDISFDEGEFIDADESASEAEKTDVRAQLLLESELQKAISESSQNDNDLAMMIIRIKELREGSEKEKAVAAVLTEKIGNMGIIYHYNDGFAVLIKNTNLDTALATAQALYSVLSHNVQEINENDSIAIGLSSRCERIITSQRLLTEAEQAVLHAAEDKESPIIAFRVNPEKYRQFMQKNN
ncbi:MAG: hypothetical protein IJS09_04720 [Treponema sp.]|nr:hypothetical protein [Treponema sp.]